MGANGPHYCEARKILKEKHGGREMSIDTLVESVQMLSAIEYSLQSVEKPNHDELFGFALLIEHVKNNLNEILKNEGVTES